MTQMAADGKEIQDPFPFFIGGHLRHLRLIDLRLHTGASGVSIHVRFACDSSTASAMIWAFRPS